MTISDRRTAAATLPAKATTSAEAAAPSPPTQPQQEQQRSSNTLATGRTALFGYPISLSLAPTFHAACFARRGVPAPAWTCTLLESETFADLARFVDGDDARRAFGGCAVTMPHKAAVLQWVDAVDEEAAVIGAANTVYWRETAADDRVGGSGGKRLLAATNTDVAGIAHSILAASPPTARPASSAPRRPPTAIVVGGGGTTRTAIYTLRRVLGCGAIHVVNRLDSEVAAIVADFTARGFDGVAQVRTPEEAAVVLEGVAPDVVVNAIPSHPPATPGEHLARSTIESILALPPRAGGSAFGNGTPVFLEMCYHPHPWTEISGVAASRGWRVIQGMECMYHQAIAQQVLWLPFGAAPGDADFLRDVDAAKAAWLEAGRAAVLEVLRKRGVGVGGGGGGGGKS
ncbi:hypothetical protein DFJ73DRAFT_795492 [Zopfochytrium polystomum]|nr:hypothetical protein DFJ73DRAFT_795492 [Zopfochytrium polystomum]